MSDVISRLILTEADITTLEVDAIVNAANSALCGGGGVDGAIHAAAGPGLLDECRSLGRCETGAAVVTAGHNLPARLVIHTVGPVWSGGGSDEAALLASAYRASLGLAQRHEVKTVAFPAISCGAYRFPVLEATRIAIRECSAFLSESELPLTVRFCCFEADTVRAYRRVLGELGARAV